MRQEGCLWLCLAWCTAPDKSLQLRPAPAAPADSTCLPFLLPAPASLADSTCCAPQGKQASLQASLQTAEAKLEASQAQADDLAAQLAGAQATARDLSEQVGSGRGCGGVVLGTTVRHDPEVSSVLLTWLPR